VRDVRTATGTGRKDHTAAFHLIAFALAVAMPLLLLVGALLYRSVTLEREQIRQRIVQVLEALIADVDRDMDRRIALLETLSTSPSLSAEDWAGFYKQAKDSLRGRAYLVLVDRDGRQILNTFVPYGEEPKVTGDPATLQKILQNRRPVISDLFTSLVAMRFVYNVSIPVLRDNEVRYVMSLGLLPEDLHALLESQSLPPDWSAAIWDGNGVTMARTRDQERLLGTAVPRHLMALPPEKVVRTTNIEGEEALIAVGRGHWGNWSIDVSFPGALVDRQLRDSLLFWGATLLLVSALVVGLAFLFGRTLTRPLAAATAAASALGRGEPFAIHDSPIREINAVNAALRRARRDIDAGSAALRDSEEQLRAAAEAAQFGAHQYDVVHDRTWRSPQFLEILGADAADTTATFEAGLGFVHPDDRAATGRRKQQILQHTEDRYQLEYRICRRDGQVRWVMDRGQVIRDKTGAAQRVIGVVLDITDIKEAEQRQRLLFEELNHRVKNTLAIVQALALQTLKTRPQPDEFADAFSDRLNSLARAHSLLTEDSWRGASLQDIVTTSLSAFIDEGRSIDVGGDAVMVPAGATVTLSLMLHELATNAAKHGALSITAGRLAVRWTATSAGTATIVDLRWQEDGGPPVLPPTRRSFGSRLLASSAKQLGAEFELDFAEAGLRCQLRFPVLRVRQV